MQNKYYPPHIHTHYSLLDGLSTIDQVVNRLDDLELDGCAITDHNSLSGSVKFFKAMTKAGKKPILGIEFSVCPQHSSVKDKENKKLSHQLLYAKKQQGWADLLNLTYQSNQTESFYYKPRLSMEELAEYSTTNMMTATGHLGSTLANAIVFNDEIQDNWKKDGIKVVKQLQTMFGHDNVLLEVQLIDSPHNPLATRLGECVRVIGQLTSAKCIASTDAHYCTQDQHIDQQVLLAAGMNKTLVQASATGMSFFKGQNYHIPSSSELLEYGNTEEEIENTKILAECSGYDLLSRPMLPAANVPDGRGSADEYLRHLCRDGWRRKIQNKIPKHEQQVYVDRVKEELQVLQSVKLGNQTLSDYFLIIHDLVTFCKKNQWVQSPGRGSSAGCFTSYLLDLTKIDPIKYNLIFSRFYNEGRNTAERVSLPDFDLDSLSAARPQLIEYIKDRYGHDKVTQICTFGTLKGRSALKTVFRAHNDLSFDVLNDLTKQFPDEAKIASELKDTEDSSLIRYTLEHDKGELKDYCYVDDDGQLQGPLSKRFAQAIRLEGCIYSKGIHPAGVVILSTPMAHTLPVSYDSKNKTVVSALPMNDVEDCGHVKLDILSINMLDRIQGVKQILETGNVE